MKKVFKVIAKNPIWDTLQYDKCGVYDSKDKANQKRKDLKSLGFTKVYIKMKFH